MQFIRLTFIAVVAVIALSDTKLHAVIEAKLPISSIYGISKGVVIGSVEKVNADTGDMDVVATETLNGEGFEGKCRIAVQVAEIRPKLAAGQPAVIFLSKRDPKACILHVGNTWALATYDATKRIPFFIVTGVKPDFPHTFPGSTDTLITILRELKRDGKTSLLDKVDPAIFAAGVKEIGKVAGPVTDFRSGDFDGDGKADLAVATAAGVSVYAIDGGAVMQGKAPAPKDFPTKPPTLSDALAVAPGNYGPSGETETIVVRAKSVVREAGGDKPVTADFVQLTGDPVKVYLPAVADAGLKSALAASIDFHGDGRRDALILTEDSAIALINRGYGAFFVIPKVKDLLAKDGKYPFPIDPGTKLAAADLDGDKKEELIIVTADGRVYVAK